MRAAFEAAVEVVRWINKYRLMVGVLYFFTAWRFFERFRADTAVNNFMVALSLTCWVMSTYLFNKVYDGTEDAISQPREAAERGERRVLLAWAVGLLLAPLALLGLFGAPLWLYLLMSPIGFLYSYPLVHGARIKNLLIIKNVYWACFGWYVPLVLFSRFCTFHALHPVSLKTLAWIGGPIFAVIWCYEMLWDIRDVEGDRQAGVRTVPVVFGPTVTRLAVLVVIGTLAPLAVLDHETVLYPFIAYVASLALLASPRMPPAFYHGMLYGQAVITLHF